MARITRGIEHGQRGQRDAARHVLQAVWDALGSEGDPLYRCAAAHAMADVQDEPQAELRWDLRALAAAAEITDERVAMAGVDGPVLVFYPSLHLNLADVYRRLGERSFALDHVRLGLAALDGLAPSDYLATIRRSLERIRGELRGVPSDSVPPFAHLMTSERGERRE